jgi:GNAT superfamily N-acetyltransferase
MMPAIEAPLHGVDHFRLINGTEVAIRPIRPTDADALQAYVRALSRESRYNRFFGALNELPRTEIDRVTHADGRQSVALIAEIVVESKPVMIGEARLIVTEPGVAEFAVSVADAFRGQGLGRLVLSIAECRARALGAAQLAGDVLRTNRAMLRLVADAGFGLGWSDDARVVRIAKNLSRPRVGKPCSEFALAQAA